MLAQDQQASSGVVAKDHRRIDQLVVEIEKLIRLLEAERLVEPMKMIDLKRELHMLREES
jgi:hypothetical protein